MKARIICIALVVTAVLIVVSCKKQARITEDESYAAEPVLPETPYDYRQSGNDHLATLGRVLFFDKNLSLNNSVSCASCHQQNKAFCDNLTSSVGLDNSQTSRNAPSIFGRAGKMFWDARANNMQDLVLRPIKNHIEMRFENLNQLTEKISKISYYSPLFYKAFGSYNVDTNKVKLAMADFLGNFRFSNNKFNRVLVNRDQFTAAEEMGRTVFFGKGRCSTCHRIEDPNPGSGYGYGQPPSLAIGGGIFNIGLEEVYHDNGVGLVTKNTKDYGKFLTPVLLNIEFTAPYMHDGRFKTLEEVVEHYNSGIQNHPNLDIRLRDIGDKINLNDSQLLQEFDTNHNGVIDPEEAAAYPPIKLGLTESEKNALVVFLKTLSDGTIFTDVKFSDPFRMK